jgi:glycosyltransferase involved in cell wall biosynthesis
MSPDAPLVTVITPTYNRAHTLPRLFESLKRQSFDDFEWVIVDDGSTDETAAVVERWGREAPFAVRCRRQANAGRNAAVNRGVELARGEYVAVIGDDDWYRDEAIERMVAHWSGIPAERRALYADVEGLTAAPDGTVRPSRPPEPVFDSDYFEFLYLHRGRGDRVGMWRRAVLGEFPFPEELDGEPVTDGVDGLVWNRVAARYLTRYVDELWGYVDYSPDGLSARPLGARMSASRGHLAQYRELLEGGRPLPVDWYWRAHANLVRHAVHNHVGVREQLRVSRSRLAWAAAAPLGLALAGRDRVAVRKLERGGRG